MVKGLSGVACQPLLEQKNADRLHKRFAGRKNRGEVVRSPAVVAAATISAIAASPAAASVAMHPPSTASSVLCVRCRQYASCAWCHPSAAHA